MVCRSRKILFSVEVLASKGNKFWYGWVNCSEQCYINLYTEKRQISTNNQLNLQHIVGVYFMISCVRVMLESIWNQATEIVDVDLSFLCLVNPMANVLNSSTIP